MASDKEKEYVSQNVKHNIRKNQGIETFSAQMANEVTELHKKVMNKIVKEFGGVYSNKKLTELERELREDIENFYDQGIFPTVDEAFTTVISREVDWTDGVLTEFAAYEAIGRYNKDAIARKAIRKTYQGHTFKYWFQAAKESDWKKINDLLRKGYNKGIPTGEVVKEVMKVADVSKNNVKTLVRSYMQHAAAEARMQVLEMNDDLIDSYIWDSTLDSRTTPHICGLRDGKEYSKDLEPIGHDLPWGAGPGRIHFNCRSDFVPSLTGMSDLNDLFTRPAVSAGPDYERGDNKTRNGTPRKATRANTKNGIFKVTNVKGSTKYEGWLKSQKTSYVADVLGSEQAALDYKAGKISLLDYAKNKNVSIKNI